MNDNPGAQPSPTNPTFPTPATGFRDYLIDATIAFERHSHQAADYDHDFDEPYARGNAERLIDTAIRQGTDPLLPAWEAVYEPGNVSTYPIGYTNDETSAKAAAEAWLRSQAEVTGRLEWEPWGTVTAMPDGYDAWFELVEQRDDGIPTGPGLIVRRRAATPAGPAPATDRDGEELAKRVARAIWALKSPPPPGSQHYQSGWDDGLEAAIDAARDALAAAVLPAPADRAAVLLEAADAVYAKGRPTCEPDGDCCWYDAVTELRRLAGEAQQDPTQDAVARSGQPETDEETQDDPESVVAPHCDGFPTACPNSVPVPPAPPHHDGGFRCGCYDEPAMPPV